MYKQTLKVFTEDWQAYNMGESVVSSDSKEATIWIPKAESPNRFIDFYTETGTEYPLYSADGTDITKLNPEAAEQYIYGLRITPVLIWNGSTWGAESNRPSWSSGSCRSFKSGGANNVYSFTGEATGLPDASYRGAADIAYYLEQHINWDDYTLTPEELYFGEHMYNGHWTSSGPPTGAKSYFPPSGTTALLNIYFRLLTVGQQDEGRKSYSFDFVLDTDITGLAMAPLGVVYFYVFGNPLGSMGIVFQNRFFKKSGA